MNTTTLYILFLVALFFFFSFSVSLINERKLARKIRKHSEPSDVLSFELTQEEYHKTLNFMLMYNVIDGKQYNELLLKGSPFLG